MIKSKYYFLIYSVFVCFLVLSNFKPVLGNEDKLFTKRRREMVSNQIHRRGISNPNVLQAMRSVKRHLFVEPSQISSAYKDRPLPIGYGQTISQPYIVAFMTELLKPNKEDVILEIGTGSGYQAAVLSEIVKQVYTIEIVKPLGEKATKRLHYLGYQNVQVKVGDGYYGWKEHGPFDGIVVTAAATHIPPPLIEQLKPGGRMVIPVGPVFYVQQLMLVEKEMDGTIRQRSLMPVRFVPFTRRDGSASREPSL